MPDHSPLIAVDIGNSRLKFGWFDHVATTGLPEPDHSLTLDPNWQPEQLLAWLGDSPQPLRWRIASVQRTVAAQLTDWLHEQKHGDVRQLSRDDLPLKIDVEQPELVGMDRLASSVACNRLRESDRPAVVISVGSAIVVNFISTAGVFSGGAILPGIAMSAKALKQFTDLLPLIPMSELAEPPPALGRSTIAAMRSGLYWGAVGAMRELIARMSAGGPRPQVFLTGGAAPAVAALLNEGTEERSQYLPHLTLAGIAIASSPS
jgi:type III pantothenate kinase